MSRTALRPLLLLGLAVATPAWAYVWFGNPSNVIVRIDRAAGDITSATGTLAAIRMHACGGGSTDFAVNQTLDLTTPYTRTVSPGAWCGVSAVWASEVEISNGSWTVVHDEALTSLEIEANPEQGSTAMTPFDVTAGTFSGFAPRLYFTVVE